MNAEQERDIAEATRRMWKAFRTLGTDSSAAAQKAMEDAQHTLCAALEAVLDEVTDTEEATNA